MWSSSGDFNNNSNSNRVVSCSPSKSSTCSSHSPFSPSSPNPNTPATRKSMEEVWKDISFTSLQDSTTNTLSSTTTDHPTFGNMILQNFLPQPFNKNSSARGAAIEPFASDHRAPPPATVLSLNSGSDFQYLESSGPVRPNPQLHSHASVATHSFVASLNYPFEALGSSSVFRPFCKKRAPECDDNSCDRRHRRMIKNRESAARSRARKQAYTTELELEVAHLLEENAKLRRQQEKFLADPGQTPKKPTLHRTLTAPF